ETVHDFAWIAGIEMAGKAQIPCQLLHLLVVGDIGGRQSRHSARAGHLDESTHEQAAKSSTLPVIGDRHRAFAVVVLIALCVATDADFELSSILVDERNEGHLLVEVEIRQLAYQGIAWLLDLAMKAHASGLVGQTPDEVAFKLGIFLANGANGHGGAIGERLPPEQILDSFGGTIGWRASGHGRNSSKGTSPSCAALRGNGLIWIRPGWADLEQH